LVYIGAAGVQNASLISTFDDYPNREVKLVTLKSASFPFDASGFRIYVSILRVDSRNGAGNECTLKKRYWWERHGAAAKWLRYATGMRHPLHSCPRLYDSDGTLSEGLG